MACDNILIIDDEAEVRGLISDVLTDEGYHTELASNESEAISCVKNSHPNLVFLDLWIGNDEIAGIKILDKIKKFDPQIPVVIISGHGTIDSAVHAIQKGAFDFIEKPFVIDRLLLTCKQALELCHLRNENSVLKCNKVDTQVFFVGRSVFSQTLKNTIEQAAPNNSRIFIKGRTGIGVDALALAIHKKSSRAKQAFVYVNCAADNKERLDELLFGTEKSYSKIEEANSGTLFLEEVSELSPSSQHKLLQFIQCGRYTVGNRNVYSDIRLIVSSNRDPLLTDETFSSELFYRLNIVTIDVLSIAERREDILPIINYYLKNSEYFFGLKAKNFTESAMAVLQSYNWPGNIQQIKNAVESSLIRAAQQETIDTNSLPPELISSTEEKLSSLNVANFITLPLKEAKDMFETDYLRAQIERFSWNITKTAQFIGMERSALHRKLKSLGIQSHKNLGDDECKD